MKKPLALIILDGFGYNPNDYGNAIKAANTPNIDALFAKYPHTLIGASGMDVGLQRQRQKAGSLCYGEGFAGGICRGRGIY